MLLASRRFDLPIPDAARLVGVRITPATYGALCDYDALLEVHRAAGEMTSPDARRAKAAAERFGAAGELKDVYLEAHFR